MRTKIALITSLAALGALLPASAFAQDAAAPAAPAAAPAAEAPPAAPAPPPPPPPEAATAPAPAAAPAAPAAWPGWFRLDSDGGGVQLWAGATAPLADGIGLAFDAYVFQGAASLGEFDIGPAIAVSSLTLTPMIGVQFDWTNRTFAALVPQLYLTGSIGPIYEELWLQYYNYKSVYDYTGKVGLANSYFYARAFVDYKINDYIGVGPQLELTQDFELKEMTSMPVGANVFFFQAGAGSTFQAFLGYETKDPSGKDNHLAGRFSVVHNL